LADAPRQRWSLTQDAFDELLSSLDPDRNAAGKRYLEIRRNLVRLFEWRGCSTPDEYADETINRCAKRIADGEEIRDIGTYSIGIARMLLREKSRDRGREARSLDEAPEPRTAPAEPSVELEVRVECLRRCLDQLTPENREFILTYYDGDKGRKIQTRKGLGKLFGVPAGTLRMRALRLREKLQLCTEKCVRVRTEVECDRFPESSTPE
jgi:DNA-directed RNA polymerase specialized sigma24 family protein